MNIPTCDGQLANSTKDAKEKASELATTIKKTNRVLSNCRVEAWLTEYDQHIWSESYSFKGGDETVVRAALLGFTRIDRQWQVAVRSHTMTVEIFQGTESNRSFDHLPPFALADADLSIQFAAARHLDALVKEIKREVHEQVSIVENSVPIALTGLSADVTEDWDERLTILRAVEAGAVEMSKLVKQIHGGNEEPHLWMVRRLIWDDLLWGGELQGRPHRRRACVTQ